MKVQIILFLMLAAICLGKQHTHFVIIGGTGDLARKYLWDSALKLFVHNFNENSTFSFYAAARIPQKSGDEALQDILDDVQCDVNDEMCHKLRPTFMENVKYMQLKTAGQYAELCKNFSSKEEGNEVEELSDIKMIFYLSIPSSAYESVAKSIHDNCHQDNKSGLKVVLEKPFGSDKKSALHQVLFRGKKKNAWIIMKPCYVRLR